MPVPYPLRLALWGVGRPVPFPANSARQSPLASGALGAVLLHQPLACATELQPRAVHQQVHRRALPAFGRGTSSVATRRLRVEWSSTGRSRPSNCRTEPISPSVWRNARRNTARRVTAVVIARLE